MRLTGSLDEPELAFLPWTVPLEEWPEDLVVALPRGISRHIVRFVRINGVVYAIKEVEAHFATREYELLFDLVRRGLPTVEPFRSQSVALLKEKGVDAIISFRAVLQDLIQKVEANRNYRKSDTLQVIRILKNYDLLKDAQMDLEPRR